MSYTDSQLREKTQRFYLSWAGFVIELIFTPTELGFYKRKLIETVLEVWGRGGFLIKKAKRVDFRIEFDAEEKRREVLVRELEKKFFFLVATEDFQKKRFQVYYSASFGHLNLLLREIFVYLLRKSGFLLHCSSFLDKKGALSAFLAHSGGGKTTVANILRDGNKHFSDDIIAVRKLKEGWGFYSPLFIEKEKTPANLKALKANFYFIKKAKVASKSPIKDKSKILPLVLEQIWQAREGRGNVNLALVLKFVKENNFYLLGSVLNKRKMLRVFGQD